jgi:hypothetical protein
VNTSKYFLTPTNNFIHKNVRITRVDWSIQGSDNSVITPDIVNSNDNTLLKDLLKDVTGVLDLKHFNIDDYIAVWEGFVDINVNISYIENALRFDKNKAILTDKDDKWNSILTEPVLKTDTVWVAKDRSITFSSPLNASINDKKENLGWLDFHTYQKCKKIEKLVKEILDLNDRKNAYSIENMDKLQSTDHMDSTTLDFSTKINSKSTTLTLEINSVLKELENPLEGDIQSAWNDDITAFNHKEISATLNESQEALANFNSEIWG